MKEIKIGKQIWMAENLNVDKFINGEPIPQIKTNREWINVCNNKQPAWCYYDNNAAFGKMFGKLYNFYAICGPKSLIPNGWRIPNEKDWFILLNYLGKSIEKEAAIKLKSTKGWNANGDQRGNGNNSTGFTALPGGWRNHDQEDTIFSFQEKRILHSFQDIGSVAAWWFLNRTTNNGGQPGVFQIDDYNRESLFELEKNTAIQCGYSVRLIKA